jgi:hypothetical protein
VNDADCDLLNIVALINSKRVVLTIEPYGGSEFNL